METVKFSVDVSAVTERTAHLSKASLERLANTLSDDAIDIALDHFAPASDAEQGRIILRVSIEGLDDYL